MNEMLERTDSPKAGYGPAFVWMFIPGEVRPRGREGKRLFRLEPSGGLYRLIPVDVIPCPNPGSHSHMAEWARNNGWPDCDKHERVNHWIYTAHYAAHPH